MNDATMDTKLESTQEVEVEMNVDVDIRDQIKLQAHQTIEVLQLLVQGSRVMYRATVLSVVNKSQ